MLLREILLRGLGVTFWLGSTIVIATFAIDTVEEIVLVGTPFASFVGGILFHKGKRITQLTGQRHAKNKTAVTSLE